MSLPAARNQNSPFTFSKGAYCNFFSTSVKFSFSLQNLFLNYYWFIKLFLLFSYSLNTKVIMQLSCRGDINYNMARHINFNILSEIFAGYSCEVMPAVTKIGDGFVLQFG
ncbi:hypothetical protein ACOSQ3_012917 [Xanthoceras sorbifolium]